MSATGQPVTAAPCTALVTGTGVGRTELHRYPMTTVQSARAEHGASLADARAFVADVCCTGCGMTSGQAAACPGCWAPCCACTPDPHEGHPYCAGCQPPACRCAECDA